MSATAHQVRVSSEFVNCNDGRARVKRIGFIGTENSHTDHFIRFLNREGRHPGFIAAALAGGENERNLALAEAGDIGVVVDEPADLIGRVDAAIISTRDGALHREQAEPLLRAGIPVLVDKPLATTVSDADAILRTAETSGALVYSASALRFVPQVGELTEAGRAAGALRHLHVAGAGDPDSPYSGLFFYGIHHVETALEMLGDPVIGEGDIEVAVQRVAATTVATLRLGNAEVTLTFVVPSESERTPFHATAVHAGGVLTRELSLGPDYNAPALAAFVGAITSGHAPADANTMRTPVAVLSAIVDALPTGEDNS
ncbi:Gfo/Idh/MocA family protein [Microbacterium sp. JB110]|uniref:Gfo/Idh/MocA family protein n=1 Tax=Microbacterium sp. JB110 TaxID=2024477 RepID=UPI00097EE97B|nr:Gfo/Idh/MocA family oxidoreductase [Microbacterium sp. JB110]RCS60216.1 gfo/Idh/MocA family oxidoreductase [Microbacterium sp. JB110]SJM45491.1 putative dehydrogenase [Frigoribacterium sp. JB110]